MEKKIQKIRKRNQRPVKSAASRLSRYGTRRDKEAEALFILGTMNGDAYSDHDFKHAEDNSWGEW